MRFSFFFKFFASEKQILNIFRSLPQQFENFSLFVFFLQCENHFKISWESEKFTAEKVDLKTAYTLGSRTHQLMQNKSQRKRRNEEKHFHFHFVFMTFLSAIKNMQWIVFSSPTADLLFAISCDSCDSCFPLASHFRFHLTLVGGAQLWPFK